MRNSQGTFEKTCEACTRQGLPEGEAVRQTLSQAEDWRELRRRIQNARAEENLMPKRVLQFWLPGFLTLLLSIGLLMLIQFFGPRPQIRHRSGWTMIAAVAVIYVPWLLSLPLIGFMGALLSGRAGASQGLVFFPILFAVLRYLTFFLVGFPMALIVDEPVGHNILLSAFFVGLFAWVLLPGMALLLGGLPTQLFLSRRLTSRGIVRH